VLAISGPDNFSARLFINAGDASADYDDVDSGRRTTARSRLALRLDAKEVLRRARRHRKPEATRPSRRSAAANRRAEADRLRRSRACSTPTIATYRASSFPSASAARSVRTPSKKRHSITSGSIRRSIRRSSKLRSEQIDQPRRHEGTKSQQHKKSSCLRVFVADPDAAWGPWRRPPATPRSSSPSWIRRAP
jgi:hypothetical protein